MNGSKTRGNRQFTRQWNAEWLEGLIILLPAHKLTTRMRFETGSILQYSYSKAAIIHEVWSRGQRKCTNRTDSRRFVRLFAGIFFYFAENARLKVTCVR